MVKYFVELWYFIEKYGNIMKKERVSIYNDEIYENTNNRR